MPKGNVSKKTEELTSQLQLLPAAASHRDSFIHTAHSALMQTWHSFSNEKKASISVVWWASHSGSNLRNNLD